MRTSWHAPNASYESKLEMFVKGIFETQSFSERFEAFVAPLILPGRINSLAQTFIKMLIPGVPDFYQGSELWDLSLVDPRYPRPVDYEGTSPAACSLRVDDRAGGHD